MRQRAFCALLGPMAKRLTAKQAVADVKGLRSVLGQQLVRHLQRHLDRIRLQERQNAHGNRQLFLSDIFVALLLAFYHPIVRSLRTIDALSCTQAAQQTLTINRIARSTLSDANRMVDPALLQPLLQDLVERVDFKGVAGDLNELTARLVAVDGTFFRVVGELLWTFQQRIDDHRKVSKPRLDVQLDLNTGVPRFVALSGHEQSECNAARLHIEAGKIYLGDKAYFGFDLLRDWLDRGADFVVALNTQINFSPTEHATPPAEHAEAVLSDQLGQLTGCQHSKPPKQLLREVLLRCEDGGSLRLLTSLTDPSISAHTIGELYRHRWTVEVFFRWLKSCTNFKHVISHSPNGLSVALYVAIIGTLLSTLVTGHRPSKMMFTVLSFIAAGWSSLEEMMPSLERSERERRQARERRRRAKK